MQSSKVLRYVVSSIFFVFVLTIFLEKGLAEPRLFDLKITNQMNVQQSIALYYYDTKVGKRCIEGWWNIPPQKTIIVKKYFEFDPTKLNQAYDIYVYSTATDFGADVKGAPVRKQVVSDAFRYYEELSWSDLLNRYYSKTLYEPQNTDLEGNNPQIVEFQHLYIANVAFRKGTSCGVEYELKLYPPVRY